MMLLLDQIIYRMTDCIRLEVTKINIKKVLLEVKDIVKIKYNDNISEIILKKYAQEEFINVELKKVKRLFVNGISYVHQHNPSKNLPPYIKENFKKT